MAVCPKAQVGDWLFALALARMPWLVPVSVTLVLSHPRWHDVLHLDSVCPFEKAFYTYYLITVSQTVL